MKDCTIVRDKKDKHILVASEVGKADYIVSGDIDLLTLKKYKNIPIVKSKEVFVFINK